MKSPLFALFAVLQAQSEHFKVFEETIAECDRLRGYATQFIRDYVSHLAIVSFFAGISIYDLCWYQYTYIIKCHDPDVRGTRLVALER